MIKKYKYVLWNAKVVDRDLKEVWKDNVLKVNHYNNKDLDTGIKDANMLMTSYMNSKGFVLSPVIQIYDTKKALHILQWCNSNFIYPTHFSRKKMMLGNEIAMTYYNLKHNKNFYFFNEYYTTCIESETSETFLQRTNLLIGYNNARQTLLTGNTDIIQSKLMYKIFYINTKDAYFDSQKYKIKDSINQNPSLFLEEIYLKYNNNIIGDYINNLFDNTIIINEYYDDDEDIFKKIKYTLNRSTIEYKNGNVEHITSINDVKYISIEKFKTMKFIYIKTE